MQCWTCESAVGRGINAVSYSSWTVTFTKSLK
jgi:hypothetical protein